MVVFMPSDEIREKYEFLGAYFVINFCSSPFFGVAEPMKMYIFWMPIHLAKGSGRLSCLPICADFSLLVGVFTCFLKGQMRLNSSQGIIRGNIIPSHPSTHLKDKKSLFLNS